MSEPAAKRHVTEASRAKIKQTIKNRIESGNWKTKPAWGYMSSGSNKPNVECPDEMFVVNHVRRYCTYLRTCKIAAEMNKLPDALVVLRKRLKRDDAMFQTCHVQSIILTFGITQFRPPLKRQRTNGLFLAAEDSTAPNSVPSAQTVSSSA